MVIRAVFFDAGHTLLTAHPDLGTVYAEATARFGVRLPPSAFAEAFRPVFRAFVREYVREGDAGDAQDYAMWREITRRIHARMDPLREVPFEPWFEALYRRFGEPEVWRLYDDAVPTLRELRGRGLRLGIVSNWDTRLRRIAEGHGLDRLVDFLVISAEAGARKPDPRIFRAALAQADVAPAEALHVGDLADEDVEGALAAGLRAVLLDREGTAAADGVPTIRSLAELPRLV
jgi:putative hydrolase of the HAD superfamily